MRAMRCFFLIPLLGFALAACEGRPAAENRTGVSARHPEAVVATNYPLYFFASEIAGGSPEITLPEIDGDPANWRPGAEDIAQMQSASLVILNGAGYESWLDWVTVDEKRLLDTSAPFADRLIPLTGQTVHQHGPEGEHSHGGTAFTTWLDPGLAAEQATAIELALSRLYPGQADRYRRNLDSLTARLEDLDLALRDAFSGLQEQPLFFSHPVYQYLEARYGLDGVSVHWEPGADPGAVAWVDFQKALREHPAKVMIWEDAPAETTAERLERLGIRPVIFHTVSNPPAEGDYFDAMQANVERLLLR